MKRHCSPRLLILLFAITLTFSVTLPASALFFSQEEPPAPSVAAFAKNEIGVLVSTTVIEVGVNVPNATLMVIENAERFGMSQLHQLRGRVGRGKEKSYCILVSEAQDESPAGKRLQAICQNHSGYDIANEDLKQRGPGDFFPRPGQRARQSGEFSFSVAFACDDPELPSFAAMAAQSLYDEDPSLSCHDATKRRMDKLFSIAQHTIN